MRSRPATLPRVLQTAVFTGLTNPTADPLAGTAGSSSEKQSRSSTATDSTRRSSRSVDRGGSMTSGIGGRRSTPASRPAPYIYVTPRPSNRWSGGTTPARRPPGPTMSAGRIAKDQRHDRRRDRARAGRCQQYPSTPSARSPSGALYASSSDYAAGLPVGQGGTRDVPDPPVPHRAAAGAPARRAARLAPPARRVLTARSSASTRTSAALPSNPNAASSDRIAADRRVRLRQPSA